MLKTNFCIHSACAYILSKFKNLNACWVCTKIVRSTLRVHLKNVWACKNLLSQTQHAQKIKFHFFSSSGNLFGNLQLSSKASNNNFYLCQSWPQKSCVPTQHAIKQKLCWKIFEIKTKTIKFNPFIFIKKNRRDILLTVFTDLKHMN